MKKKKVVVAMSGGVDSSTAAALLKRAGFNVVGVFMKFWLAHRSPAWPAGRLGEGGVGYNRCCSTESEQRAREVARILGIPFYVLNFSKEFKKKIVGYFIKEYQAGKTPNPCVVCNKEIKFGLLLEKALALEADYIATGHYAKIKKEFVNSRQIRYSLISAKDKEKDQSYFLWKLNQKQLKHILFPVGDYTKKEVRELAGKFGLPIVATPESQEVCFIQKTINEFLARYIKLKPGKIACLRPDLAHRKDRVVGQHQGLAFYTIGQRKGIGLPGGSYWVLDKDFKKNLLIVTKNEKDLLKKELTFKNVNWLSGKPPKFSLKVKAKIRYRSNLAPAVIHKIQNTKYKILFSRPQRAITPGQSVVFYEREELLGGGIIC